MNSLCRVSKSQCKQRSVAGFDTLYDTLRSMINKQNNDKQISEKVGFSMCKFMVWVHLAFKYARVSTNSCFYRKNLWFLRKPRWYGYLPGNYIPAYSQAYDTPTRGKGDGFILPSSEGQGPRLHGWVVGGLSNAAHSDSATSTSFKKQVTLRVCMPSPQVTEHYNWQQSQKISQLFARNSYTCI